MAERFWEERGKKKCSQFKDFLSVFDFTFCLRKKGTLYIKMNAWDGKGDGIDLGPLEVWQKIGKQSHLLEKQQNPIFL